METELTRFSPLQNAGNLLCKLVKYGQELVIYASTYVLVMLSLDRYDAVINPLNFNTRTNRAKHMVFIAWLLSGLLSVPALFLNQIRSVLLVEISGRCRLRFSRRPLRWRAFLGRKKKLVLTTPLSLPLQDQKQSAA